MAQTTKSSGVPASRLSNDPHMEGTWPFTKSSLRKTLSGVPISEMEAMLGGNAVELYGLDGDQLSAVAAPIGSTADELSQPLPDSEIPAGADITWAFRTNGAWS